MLVVCLVLLVSCGPFLQSTAANFEGEACTVQDEMGTCVLVTSCPSAVEELKKRKKPSQPTCGFSGRIPIICCANSEVGDILDKAPKLHNRRSMEACEKYSQMIEVDVQPQILGGEEAVIGEFPHMAALAYDSDSSDTYDWGQCGGCLISELYVLTAAHCVVRLDQKVPKIVRLGKVDLVSNRDNSPAYDYDVVNITVHPDYNISTKIHDIAILRLAKNVTMNKNVLPACLYNKNDDPPKLIITGWGLTANQGNGSDVLLKTSVKPVDVNSCNDTFNAIPFPRLIVRSQLCAVSNDSKVRDTCQGDSGSPVQIQESKESFIYSVVGVTSYGRGCGGKTPSIYTRVASYFDWIQNIVWPMAA